MTWAAAKWEFSDRNKNLESAHPVLFSHSQFLFSTPKLCIVFVLSLLSKFIEFYYQLMYENNMRYEMFYTVRGYVMGPDE